MRALWFASLGLAGLAFCLAGAASAAEPLRIATATFPDNYGNPYSTTSVTYSTNYSALFDPLTLVTSDGALQPWLAVGWTQEAPTRWVIKLRPDVVFANGEPFTAEAILVALEYLKSDAGKRDAVSRDLGVIVGAKARDPLTVEIETAGIDVQLPRELSLLRPAAPVAWRSHGAEGFNQDPIGTGPYRLVRRTPTLVTFAAVPTSWRKAPAPALEVKVILDPGARRAALMTGSVDVVNTAIAPDEVADVQAAGGSVFYDPLPSVVGIALNNTKSGPLQDRRVRQALNYAVDKDTIAKVLWGGRTTVASQMVPPGAFGYNAGVDPYPYDPAKARALLKEAGFANGFPLVFEAVIGTVMQSDIFQKVADDLAQVGVTMRIDMIPNARFLENQQTGAWKGTAAALPYFSPTLDPLYAMSTQICTSPVPWFCDREITDTVQAARAAPTLDQRRALTEKVMALSHDAALGIFLYNSITLVGLGPRIAHYRQDFNFIRYEDIAFK